MGGTWGGGGRLANWAWLRDNDGKQAGLGSGQGLGGGGTRVNPGRGGPTFFRVLRVKVTSELAITLCWTGRILGDSSVVIFWLRSIFGRDGILPSESAIAPPYRVPSRRLIGRARTNGNPSLVSLSLLGFQPSIGRPH